MIDIIRPTLVLDKDVCINNIEKMAYKANKYNLRFRPHFKTHQSAKIGEWFKLFGVDAITVSSVQMAEYFASHGWDDITIAFPVNILEIENINRLAAAIKLNVIIENKEGALALAQKITSPLGIYIKIDTGSNRSGILPGKINIIEALIKLTGTNKHLLFKGFLAHSGHTYQTKSPYEVFSLHFDALMKMRSLKQRYKHIFPHLEISIGDTPSISICDNFNGVDEIRPGNFVFYDLMQYKLGACTIEDIAVRLVSPVVAIQSSRNEVVIYGGAIHLSKEPLLNINGKDMYGRVIITHNGERILLGELNYVMRLSQEHGILKVMQKNLKYFTVGSLVEILPVHSCLTANLMRRYLTTEGEEIPMMNY
ncbi:D-serine dehydratase [hydrothermal vent metagenome]|uniref:D-serine dehydratase n=1 Tax=hydrothermal vent metagenome TaxID=652676 RepID=A0A3B0TDU1_9ZZZZ